ncbi:hypothetical protein E3N88_06873 [Mikania micrantha]|uniref:Uncharacterized protein n=1 Tax=Mikania micrantha TaxID=192012 RepID=A0A5N6PS17_9ASTR|nr:hypothetical protein E3N88_06873 [Mikania micrantha]
MDKTDKETKGIPLVKQKDIVSSFVPPQNDISTKTVRVPSCIRSKGSGSHKGSNPNVNKLLVKWERDLDFVIIVVNLVMIEEHKYQKCEEAIEILLKGQEKEKKDDRIMSNSLCMLNGLVISGIKSNISTLSDLLDETEEDGGVIAREYMLNQLRINDEIHGDVKLLLYGIIDKMKKKREAVGMIKDF